MRAQNLTQTGRLWNLSTIIINNTAHKNGYTTSINGNKPYIGYMVSIPDKEVVFNNFQEFNQVSVNNFIVENLNLLKRDNYFIGTWIYEGKIYLDISINLSSKSEAIKAGKKNNQLAIYDIVNCKSINL